jgi:N-hydroxyarylamine O-acetyltransferase
MDVPSYLARIGYSGAILPNIGTLRALHRAHMLTVPFENLDIALGRTIVADERLIVRKIVNGRRGGFCYELNGAFAALLAGARIRGDVTLRESFERRRR